MAGDIIAALIITSSRRDGKKGLGQQAEGGVFHRFVFFLSFFIQGGIADLARTMAVTYAYKGLYLHAEEGLIHIPRTEEKEKGFFNTRYDNRHTTRQQTVMTEIMLQPKQTPLYSTTLIPYYLLLTVRA